MDSTILRACLLLAFSHDENQGKETSCLHLKWGRLPAKIFTNCTGDKRIFAIKTRNTTCLGGNHLFKLVLSPPNIVGHCLRVLSLLCSVSPQVKLLVPQCSSWGWTLDPCSPVLVWLLAPLCRQTAGQPAPGSSDHSHPGIMMNGCWIHLHRHSVNQTHRKVSCFT